MKKSIKLVSVCLISVIIFAFKAKDKPSKGKKEDPILLTIGEEKIPLSEFNYVYKKNNSKASDLYSESNLKEYMDLYVNFRLKVKQAEELGYDTTREFLREFKQYENQLAQPYLTEKSVTDKLVKEVYERLKTEVNASHILIRFPEDPTPEDTLKAWVKINEIKTMAEKGEDFEDLASKMSEDPSAKKNKGDLGYFSAMKMVYPFESAAYTTPKGKISNIVRTRFGYHILKVNNKRPARGEVKLKHIMIRASEGMNLNDLDNAKKKINEIHAELKDGKDWNTLCKQFSDDARTAQNGGELPWISTGKVSPDFEDAAFNLKQKGEISSPVKSPYGWHILQLVEKKELASYDEMKGTLKNQVEKDSRANLPKDAFIKRIKKENNLKENAKSKKYALSQIDTTLTNGKFIYNKENKKLKQTLFSIMDTPYSIKDYYAFIVKRQRKKIGANPKMVAERMYQEYVNESLIAYERNNLENKYEDYRLTLKEYRYGILLFKLMDEKVWSKAIKDTTGLKEFYNENKNNYQWENRFEITVISAKNGGVLSDAVKDLKSNKFESLRDLEQKYNKENSLSLTAEDGTYELKDKPFFSVLDGSIGEFRKVYNGRYYYFNVKSKINAGPKKFNETRGLLISDYQAQLEKNWIDELRKKYSFSINQEEFDKLVK